MWCPNCKTEYNDANTHCTDCGAKLVSRLPNACTKASWGRSFLGDTIKKWPLLSDNEPEKPAFLKHCSSVDMEDEMLINMLSAYGIPAIKQYPQNGGLGKIVLGMSGSGADIYVPESLLADALALMEGVSDD